ncbi:MAG: CRTAC1 family protein [Deltaproteobacteria bacterium]|nr:CRTAC1 family protein [Deltaproteobacteria bacterium]
MRTILGLGLVVLVGCSSGGSGGTGGGGTGGGALPEAVCTPGTRWASGTPAFEDLTASVGLEGVQGTRIQAVDFDGDGWTDLLVRRGGAAVDDFGQVPACCADASCAMGTSCTLRHTWLLRNDGTGKFVDVTEASGIVATRGDGGGKGRPNTVWAFADVDNDGDLDAYSGLAEPANAPQTETSELLLGNGDGTFALGPAVTALRIEKADGPAAAAFVDYDRNGAIDLYLPQSLGNRPRQERLLWGDQTGAFQDVTLSVGLATKAWPGEPNHGGFAKVEDLDAARGDATAWGGAACDLDGDGDAELLAASYGRSPNHLWHAEHTDDAWSFSNQSVESGYAFDERVDWSDNESARCWCKLHPTDEDCAGVPEPKFIPCTKDADAFRWNHAFDRRPFRLGGNSGSTICGDVDNDGDVDLLTSEIVHWDVGASSDPSELLFNDGGSKLHFSRPGNDATGLVRERDPGWNDGDITGALFDFDNDGLLDVVVNSTDYPGTRLWLYHNEGGGKFAPVPFADGIDHRRSHGIAVADFDRDGDLDVVVGASMARCGGNDGKDCNPDAQVRFFSNTLASAGNWVQLALEGAPGSNRAAIGARVTVEASDGQKQVRFVDGGHGHYGQQDDLVVHVGLGAACQAKVTVRWPDRALTEQSFEVVSGYRFRVVQGSEPVVVTSARGR